MQSSWAPGIVIASAPVRKVIGRSAQVSNGWHRTEKNPTGYCGGESDGELEFMMFAEMDPGVTLMAPQPCEIPFSHDGKLCRHVPDVAVMDRGESTLHEIKSLRQYDKPDVKRRLRAAGRSVESLGWPYFVTLKEDILGDRRYPHVADVWHYFRRNFDDVQRMAVESAVAGGERIAADVVRELASSMGDRAPAFHNLISMAANGSIFIDVEKPIGPASVIRKADPQALPARLLPRRRPADDLPWEVAP